MDSVERFLSELYWYLTDSKVIGSLVKLHSSTSELKDWDASFPLDRYYWSSYLTKEPSPPINRKDTIFDSASLRQETFVNIDTLLLTSQKWRFRIGEIGITWNKVDTVVFCFDRGSIFESVLKDAFYKAEAYGAFRINDNISLCLADHIQHKEYINYTLSDLKIVTLRKVCDKFLKFVNFQEDKEVSDKKIIFTDVDHSNKQGIKIICGPVWTKEGHTHVKMSVSEFLKQRRDDMRLMAEHRYSFSFNKPKWETVLWQLGESAATIDLLKHSHKRPTNINVNDHYVKIPAFIIYNFGMISILINSFNKQVEQEIYDPLPDIERINFELLEEPDEWELVYVYVLRFPNLIKQCFQKLPEGHVEVPPLIDMLFKLSKVSSRYYKCIDILGAPKKSNMAVLYARIYLLKAVHRVIHNSLCILDI